MRKLVPNLVVLGSVGLATIIGTVAFLAARKLAVLFNPAANDSHLLAFMIAIIGVVVGVASAFPIFGRAMPWVMARLERDWPQRPPEQTIS